MPQCVELPVINIAYGGMRNRCSGEGRKGWPQMLTAVTATRRAGFGDGPDVYWFILVTFVLVMRRFVLLFRRACCLTVQSRVGNCTAFLLSACESISLCWRALPEKPFLSGAYLLCDALTWI